MTPMDDLQRQLDGYRLTLAEIHYHLPDHPKLLQTFIWQDYDLAPRYPVLTRFLDFWVEKIEGRLHSVYVARRKLVTAADLRTVDTEFSVN